MAGTNGHNQDQVSLSAYLAWAAVILVGIRLMLPKYPEELRLSLHRLNLLPGYANVTLFQEFDSTLGGRGLRALKNIPFGSPIISESVFFSILKDETVTPAQAHLPEFQALSCPDNPWTPDRTFVANSFGMGSNAQNVEIQGIFLQSSRLNHSCVPNAHFAWNSNSDRLTVHAIQNIPEGQEILVNYRAGDYTKTRDERRHELFSHYGFNCNCRACNWRTDFGRKSEGHRKELHQLWAYIDQTRNYTLKSVRDKLLEKIRASVTTLNLEWLTYPHLADMYSEASWYHQVEMRRATRADHCRYKVSCLENALHFAREKLFLDVACSGHDSPVVEEALEEIAKLKQIRIT